MQNITIHTESANLTEEQFFMLCAENKEIRFERDKYKNIIIMSPTGFISSNFEAKIIRQLEEWNDKVNLGYVSSSSGGFTLPSGAMRVPDAAWVRKELIDALSEKELQSFPKLCPDFIIEVRSHSDSLKSQKEKMNEWLENGCSLGWLVDLTNKETYIYKHGREVIQQTFDKPLKGEDVLPEFELDLKKLIM